MKALLARVLVGLASLLGPIVAQNAATPREADEAGSEIRRIRQLIKDADQHRRAGRLDNAKQLLRKGMAACSGLPPTNADPDAQDMLWQIGVVACAAKDPDTAIRAWRRVWADRRLSLPDDHPSVATARIATAVAEAERSLGAEKNEEAGTLVRGALKACLALPRLGENREAQQVLWELGFAATAAEDLQTARGAWRQVHDFRERTLPFDHPDLHKVRQNLAATLEDLGQFTRALPLRRKVLAVWTETRHEDHPDLQDARRDLANTQTVLGDLHGALTLEETVLESLARTLPDEHLELQYARINLAGTKAQLGDLRGAHALIETAVKILSRTLPDDHLDLQDARLNLAASTKALGDLPGALALEERVVAVLSQKLPDDHPDLLFAQLNLAATKSTLGDLHTAHTLEQKVFDIRSRTLPDDHPDLQIARQSLASSKRNLGDLRGALALEQKALEVLSRTLPNDHPDLQSARMNLAMTKEALGDLFGGLALKEQVLRVRSRTLPDDHPDLQIARLNLAATKRTLGDYHAALALEEKLTEVLSRTLPDGHPHLRAARLNLAGTMAELGDLQGALAIETRELKALVGTLPDDHPELNTLRFNLAFTKHALGDVDGAIALQQQVFEARSRTLPDDHPDLQITRINLAAMKAELGDVEAALVLLERGFAALSRTHPDGHPYLQAARGLLVWSHLAMGNGERSAALARDAATAVRRRLANWTLSPREAGAAAREETDSVSLLMTLAQHPDCEEQGRLAADALLVSQALRGTETRIVRRTRRARMVDAEQTAALERELAASVAEVSRIGSTLPAGDRTQQEAALSARIESLANAVRRKEELQRQLLGLAIEAGQIDEASAGVADLARSLPARSAAVAIVGYEHYVPTPDGAVPDTETRLAALLLTETGQVEAVALAALEDVEVEVLGLRGQAHKPTGRGLSPGRAAPRTEDVTDRKKLRRLVLDPILARLADIDTVFLVVDESLELVPLDALPLDDGRLVGDAVTLRPLVSLFDLLEPPSAEVGDRPRLLALGSIEYDEIPASTSQALAWAAAPALIEARSGRDRIFAALPNTSREVELISRVFGNTYPSSPQLVRSGRDATKATLLGDAVGATFLHIATHAYFAPSIAEPSATTPSRFVAGWKQRVSGLSPLTLTGLALSGANLPPNEEGRVAGVLTAEEILALDLTQSYLVTLSACDTSVGVRRAGQCYASLRAALIGAGARFVLTSLWKVGDEATMEFMADFYRGLWLQGKEPHEALWEAKTRARKQGRAFGDWAGWIMTGR